MYETEKERNPLTPAHSTTGSFYLKGYSDGYHGRPQEHYRTKEARDAYAKGYDQGVRSAIVESGKQQLDH